MKTILPIIGMSPGNSYFKNKEVAFLLRETIRKYNKAVIMIADEPAIATYQAMGYSFSKARSKAILKGNNLKNRTKKVLDSMGLDSESIIVVDWATDISENLIFQKHLEGILTLFKNNELFRNSVLLTSKSVLENSGKDYDEEKIEQATNYLLNEIAFLEFAPDYFGVDKVTYVYHKPWRVYEDYIAGVFDKETKFHLDFKLLEAPYETYLTSEESDLSRTELIKQRGVIRCAYVPYNEELFSEKQGNYIGKFYEYIKSVAEKNSLRLEFVEQSGYGVLSERINGGFVDVFCAPVRPTKRRRLDMFFSKSLIESNIFGYMKSDSVYADKTIEELKELKELRVVVKENDIHHDIMKEFLPNARIVWLPQLAPIGEEIKYVLDNRADIAFREDKLVEKLLREEGVNAGLLTKKGKKDAPIKVYENCMALPWGDFGLKDMVDNV